MESELKSFFEPTAGAFLRYVVGFSFRYAAICGGLYLLLKNVAFLRRYKIQDESNERKAHEVRWTVSNTLVTGLFTLLMYAAIEGGYARVYDDIGEYGWGWFFLSIPLGVMGFDTWFYWQHRALHTPWLFRHCHSVHHKTTNPTTFATFAHHPVETISEDTYFLLLILVVPMHPYALGAVGLHAFTLGVLGHMGYEFFPRGFTRHWLFGWHNTSTHHNMHHSHPGGNYSLYFNWWDRFMGTNHPAYHSYFEEVKRRQRHAREVAEASTTNAPRLASNAT